MDYKTKVITTSEFHWYIWYTKPRAEKKVQERLFAKGIEVFLPLRKELRQWSDRKKWIECPLFSGYIFTKISKKDWDKVQYTEGILTFVRFDGKPAKLRNHEVENIKLVLANPDELELADQGLLQGEWVEITEGPLQGLKGEIISFRGNRKLGLRIEELGKVMLVQLPKNYVRRQEAA